MNENDCILNFKVYSNVFKDDEGVSVLSNEKQYPMTLEGKAKLEEELEYLIKVRRPDVIDRIKTARSFGDLSENSEYDSAKEEQGFVEGRISTIESMLRNALIISEGTDDATDDTTELLVSLGRTVTFDVLEDGEPEGEPESYKIVGSAEADPSEGRISNDSPMAKALMGHKVSDKVKITTPGGDMEVVILEIK